MRGIKPFRLGLLTRPFQVKSDYWLGAGILAFFPFDDPGSLSTEMEMWQFLPEALGTDLALDAGIPKGRPEVLVTGSAHQPGNKPGFTLPVRVQIGSIDKTLSVIGDRYWDRGTPTEPRPFTSMPLGWERAFGGEGFDRNPRGKGFAPIEDDQGRQVHPLPNVELAGKLIRSPKDRPDPAGFGPIQFEWPQRFSLAGTYDKKWMDEHYPGFAEDLDWRIWNLAAPDQQQDAPFRPDERFVLHNMHPEHPRLEGQLPNLVTRCFVTQRNRSGDEEFREVDTTLTTVWLFPEAKCGVLVFHAGMRVLEDDATDIVHILVAGERPGEPRPPDHYRAVLAKRLDPENIIETLNDDDLMPPGLTGMSPEVERAQELTTIEGLRGERQKKRAERKIAEGRASVEALGLDVDEHGPALLPEEEPEPSLAELPEFLKRKMEEVKQLEEQGKADREHFTEQARAFYAEVGLDFDEVENEMATGGSGPPQFSAEGQRRMFRGLADELAEMGNPSDELEMYATDPELFEKWKKLEAQVMQGYLKGAHLQSPAAAMDEEAAAHLRAEIEAERMRGESFAGRDLTGADLSGMDLSGADFTGALMESVNLEQANLEDASFAGAVLAHSVLTGAHVGGASFRDANLGKAKLISVTASGAVDFGGAELSGADLTGASLRGCTLDGVSFVEARLDHVDLRDASCRQIVVFKCSLERARMGGAVFDKASFLELDLVGVDFSGATLNEAAFVKCRSSDLKLVNANAANLRVVVDVDFEGADFRGANVEKANLRGTNLRGADFSGARLGGADLSEADLSGARLYRIVARESMWVRTKLQDAQLVSADLMGAILQKADLRGADLRGANLYGADFALIRSDRRTNVTDAIQNKVRVLPQRKPQ